MSGKDGNSKTAGGIGPAEFARGVRIVFTRELGSIFDSSMAYIYFIAFTVLTTAIFMNDFFLKSVVDMTPYFKALPLLAVVFGPALTMRAWAEEKRLMTFELLMTLPVKTGQIVLGKYLAVLVFYLVALAGSLPIPVMLYSLGRPDGGLIFSGYLGAALLGAVFMAFGLFASGLTDNQITAFVAAAFMGFFFVFTGNDLVVSVLDGLSRKLEVGTFLYENISVTRHYDELVRGVLTGHGFFYFAIMVTVFLWMNKVTVSRSRI